jgi:hypothetical protein
MSSRLHQCMKDHKAARPQVIYVNSAVCNRVTPEFEYENDENRLVEIIQGRTINSFDAQHRNVSLPN